MWWVFRDYYLLPSDRLDFHRLTVQKDKQINSILLLCIVYPSKNKAAFLLEDADAELLLFPSLFEWWQGER